jgi:hypothetical protein
MNAIRREPVESSNIRSIGYEEETQTLEVEFSKAVYHYYKVPKEEYDLLMKSSSIGWHFQEKIKDNYEYRKL